jgi:hypothetical protein
MRAVEAAVDLGSDGGSSFSDLAKYVYGVRRPTRAQLSAVRRSVSRLMSMGVVQKVPSLSGTILVVRPRAAMTDLQFRNRILETLDAVDREQTLTPEEILSRGFGIEVPSDEESRHMRAVVNRLVAHGMAERVQEGRSYKFGLRLHPYWRSE